MGNLKEHLLGDRPLEHIPDFDGETYSRTHDHARLGKQYLSVLNVMRDGRWRSLADISAIIAAPQASISARIRDMRKAKFGGYGVERRRLSGGYYQYRLAR